MKKDTAKYINRSRVKLHFILTSPHSQNSVKLTPTPGDPFVAIVMLAFRRLSPTLASSSMPTMLHNVLPVSQASTAVQHTHPQLPAPLLWSKVDSSLPLAYTPPKTQGSVVPYVWDDSFNAKRLAMSCSVSATSPESAGKSTKATEGKDNRPSPDEFEKTVDRLLFDVNHFFVRRADYSLYDAHIQFENRINGRVARNGPQFVTEMNYLRIWGHLRYPFIRMNVVSFQKDAAEAKLTFQWRIQCMPYSRMLVYYIPKKLFRMANMVEHSLTWKEGVAQVWVGPEGKVVRIVVDDKWENKKANESKVEAIKNKLERLREGGAMPAPA